MTKIKDIASEERWPILYKRLWPAAVLVASAIIAWQGIVFLLEQKPTITYEQWLQYEQAQVAADTRLGLVLIGLSIFIPIWFLGVKGWLSSSKLNTHGEEGERKNDRNNQ